MPPPDTAEPVPADREAAMAAKARAEIWPAVLEDVGVEWGQAILDKVAAAGN